MLFLSDTYYRKTTKKNEVLGFGISLPGLGFRGPQTALISPSFTRFAAAASACMHGPGVVTVANPKLPAEELVIYELAREPCSRILLPSQISVAL